MGKCGDGDGYGDGERKTERKKPLLDRQFCCVFLNRETGVRSFSVGVFFSFGRLAGHPPYPLALHEKNVLNLKVLCGVALAHSSSDRTRFFLAAVYLQKPFAVAKITKNDVSSYVCRTSRVPLFLIFKVFWFWLYIRALPELPNFLEACLSRRVMPQPSSAYLSSPVCHRVQRCCGGEAFVSGRTHGRVCVSACTCLYLCVSIFPLVLASR